MDQPTGKRIAPKGGSSTAPVKQPLVTRFGVIDVQVCVPEAWDDAKVAAFAEADYPSGTAAGWRVRTDPALLGGCPVRNPCAKRPGFVHVTLDA